jgi:SNF2 family DNA or RNA helicase
LNSSQPSLRIGFGDIATVARLRASDGADSELRTLATRFRTGRLLANGQADVEIDDLLTNIGHLTSWPFPESVQWDEDLANLARDSIADTAAVSAELQDQDDQFQPMSDDDVLRLLGPAWVGNLTDFQRRDLAKLLSLRHGANFSVPGAGKTRVALAVFQALRRSGDVARILIVGPKSSYEAWQDENALCFSEPLRMVVFGDESPSGAEVLIVNYERLSGALNTLSRWISDVPSLLILDEAHRMKLGPDGVYGAACMALGPRARRRLILTGTPAPNGSRDLENLLGFVWPGQGRRAVTAAVAGGNLSQASQVLKPLFTRTTKEELGLKPVVPKQVLLDLPPLHREIYDALVGQYSARASASQDDLQTLGRILVYLIMAAISPTLLTVGTTRYDPIPYQVPPLPIPDDSPLLDLMRDLPSYELSPKYQETLAIVRSNAELGKKTLVWSTFIRSLNTLNSMLAPFNPAVVHGGVADRESEIARFRSRDSGCMVLLSNPATLGEGISLHHDCHDAVYVDRDFAAGRYLQSIDRINRLGLDPNTDTNVTVLVSKGTIDEVINVRLAAKLDFMGSILDDPAVRQLGDLDEEPSVGGGLDQDDLQSLLGHLSGNSP